MPSFWEGDILVWPGQLYQHWGVYAGHGTVVYYADEGKSVCKQMSNAEIVSYKLSEEDLKQMKVWKTHVNPEDRRRVVERAKSRIGERSYSIAFNNCEHFAKWCDGESTSAQVGAFVKSAACTVAGVAGSIASTVAAAGTIATVSGLIEPAVGIGWDKGSDTVAAYFTITVLPMLKCARTFTVCEGEGPVGLVVGGGVLGLAGAYVAYRWLKSED